MRPLKGAITSTGYKRDSKDRFNDFNIIPSNSITMKGVDHDVLGVSDTGDVKHMKPGRTYRFSGKSVTEFPVYQGGGEFRVIKKPAAPMDTTAFMHGLAGVESDLRWDAKNPTSSASGAFQFLWNLIDDEPELKGMSEEQYLKSPEAQMMIMKKALDNPIGGGNAYSKDIRDLRKEYAPQIPGFDEMFSDMDLLLLRHKKGRQGAREYLGHTVRDGEPENVKGVNMTFPDYQAKFYRYYNNYND